MKRSALYIAIIVLIMLVGRVRFPSRQKTRAKGHSARCSGSGGGTGDRVAVLRRSFANDIVAVSTLKARQMSFVSPKVPGKVETCWLTWGGEWSGRNRRSSRSHDVRSRRSTSARRAFGSAGGRRAGQGSLERAEKEYRRAANLLAEKSSPKPV